MRRTLCFFAMAAALCGSTAPARADFYRLDGRFDCLGRADAVCFDKTPAPPDPYAPAPTAPKESERAHTALQTPPAAPAKPAPSRPPDPMLAIAQRIKEAHPAPGDLAELHRAADANDPRAVELLAWCALRGIGTTPDPLEAYRLYGKAEALAVPHAAENQRLVFERSLTSDQREHILEMEATPNAAPALLSDATGPIRLVP
ncbi:MAG TPA: hypothetical protein VL993_15155 [Stellaceae bacterium]|nr:hypothetical protein [Stellaceae bacterium]